MIYIAGLGPGSFGAMTRETFDVIEGADVIIGAARLLYSVPEGAHAELCKAILPKDILAAAKAAVDDGAKTIVVVMSGDTGFYSGTRGLIPVLEEAGLEYKVLPGISSVQMMSARLGDPWQGWNLYSAHGKDCDAVRAVMESAQMGEGEGKRTFFLTGGDLGPKDLAAQLADAGLGDLRIWIGERLSYDDEKITETTCREAVSGDFDVLAVMLADKIPAPECDVPAPGISDDLFVRGKVPMTKQDVRSAVAGRLGIRPGDVCWDVGAGTGSVTVEMALMARGGKTFAVETNPDGIALIEENRRRFGCWNIKPVEGLAPEALMDLPAPDAVFIGGTKGNMGAIVDVVKGKNPDAKIVITAIAVETLGEAIKALEERGWEAEVAQVQSSYGKKVAHLNMMMANNPIFLICGQHSE
ncbi:MAG: precorrin-6y C5,15-methyltransferase (decarboxylating) subunit CbiE [Eubacterium sp.]|nr:precorrin-6y C5,15-methyltransferase (decarboxylating) subunit CbiE [Eubacterium sp.]